MTEIVPTIGRIVWYTVSQSDADIITQHRKRFDQVLLGGHQASNYYRIGNDVHAGNTYPADIVAVWGGKPDSYVNLQVKLDGTDCFWATSRQVGEGPGFYQWMPYQKGQAAKTEALEKNNAIKAQVAADLRSVAGELEAANNKPDIWR